MNSNPQQQLSLLVCSGNLGNAQPDETSLSAWIPADGSVAEVLEHRERYPVFYETPPNTVSPQLEMEQFDIIIIGLQESTFEPPSPSPSQRDNNQSPLSAANVINNTIVRMQIPVVTARKGINKTLATLTTLTASRDHAKKLQRRQQRSGGVTSASSTVDLTSNSTTVASSHTPQQRKITLDIALSDWSGGTAVLHGLLRGRLPSYKHIVSFQRGEMRLEIFVIDQIQEVVQVLHVAAQNTGRAGLANKGGIAAELSINNRTRLSFVTAHLEAHEGSAKYTVRCNTMTDILSGTKKKLHDVTMTSHYAFVMGDLNFRTELEQYTTEEEHKAEIREMVAAGDWQGLNRVDELHRALRKKDCLVGFQTLFCNFPPTFKMERAAGYNYIDKRRPSYTDRILWKTNHQLDDGVVPLMYEPIDDFVSSDHKPVRAVFAVSLNEPYKMRPKMVRRATLASVNRLLNKQKGSTTVVHRERLYLFLSQISCVLQTTASSWSSTDGTSYANVVESTRGPASSTTTTNATTTSSVPNPYICVVSDPEEVLKEKERRRWLPWKQKTLMRSISYPMAPKRAAAKAWPCSTIKKATLEPRWQDEELKFEIKTYETDGSPVDLAGAMLHLTVMDARVAPASGDDGILGSFTFNLVNLIRSCGNPQEAAKHTSQIASRSKESTSFKEIPSVTIDEPLLKSGKETGRIQCVIEAWWMNERTAAALLSSPRANKNNNKARTDAANSDSDGNGEDATPPVFFSERRSDPYSKRKRRQGRRRRHHQLQTAISTNTI